MSRKSGEVLAEPAMGYAFGRSRKSVREQVRRYDEQCEGRQAECEPRKPLFHRNTIRQNYRRPRQLFSRIRLLSALL